MVRSWSGQINYDAGHDTNWYGKLDWNINENNILEYTKLKESNYSTATARHTTTTTTPIPRWAVVGANSYIRDDTDTNIFHYTGYLSDNATLERALRLHRTRPTR